MHARQAGAVAELEARDGLDRLPWRAMARSASRVRPRRPGRRQGGRRRWPGPPWSRRRVVETSALSPSESDVRGRGTPGAPLTAGGRRRPRHRPWGADSATAAVPAPGPRPECRPGPGWLRRDEGRLVPRRRPRTHQLQTAPAGYCCVATGLATASRRTDAHVCFDWPLGPPAGSVRAERLLAAIGDDVARPGSDVDRFGTRSGARLADRRSGGARRVMHLMILKSRPVTDRSW